MFDSAAPTLAHQLPADSYWHLIRTLRLTLPPPPGDSPEDLLLRDHAAIARIAALAPANAAEAEIAAQFVAASEQWKDCLRLAQEPQTTPQWAAKCRAQANAMMRQANAALRLLLRIQDARRKIETDAAAAERHAWSEHCAIGLMAEALAAAPSTAKPEVAEPAAPPIQTEPSPQPSEADPGSSPGEAPATPDLIRGGADLIAAAERYAAIHPERAASIRRTGRLPHDVYYFCPPEAVLARALITAHTPALAALNGCTEFGVA